MKKLCLLLSIALGIALTLPLISRESSPFLCDVNKLNENSAMRQKCFENARSLTPDLEKEVHCHYLGMMLRFFEIGIDDFDKTEDKIKFMWPNNSMNMDDFLLGPILEGLGIIKQPLASEQVNNPEVQKEIQFFIERKIEILKESIKKHNPEIQIIQE